MQHIDFDATVTSQFLKDGDTIERKGLALTLRAVCRNDVTRVVGFSYLNDEGGICSGTIPFNVDVPVGTVTEV
jgi:hypothetical protein